MPFVYGWKPDLPDVRDLLFNPFDHPKSLPSYADLRDQMPPVYDQSTLGSCTANAIAGAFEFELKKQGLSDFVPSRLFVYFNERALEGTVSYDAGALIRDGMKVTANQGVCPETEWPYDINQFTTQPTPQCYHDALTTKITQYLRVNQTLNDMKTCLAAGFPFVFGFSVYQSFESPEVAKTGIVPMPQPNESLLGGHAVLAVGYDDSKSWFIVRNSWGDGWGDKGYFYLPFEFLANPNLASDFWTIRVVT